MNREAVTDMLEAYNTQESTLSNIDDLILMHFADKSLVKALVQRKREIRQEQHVLYLMLSDEYTESIEINDFFKEIYKYITVDPPPGYG